MILFLWIHPIKKKKIINLFDLIIKLKLLKDSGVIIIHRHKKEENKFPNNFNVLIEKNYGISKIIFGNILG